MGFCSNQQAVHYVVHISKSSTKLSEDLVLRFKSVDRKLGDA
jgi:hypothetical protein